MGLHGRPDHRQGEEHATETEHQPARQPLVTEDRDHKGDTVARTFSKDVHGDGFAATATEFQKTNADRLVTE